MKIDLEKTIQLLPPADESYDWQGIKFDIYLAKNFFVRNWSNEALRALVLKCRESFWRYGSVALEDDYDKKSLVVVVGVSYLLDNRLIKEWVTIRLVPASGDPVLSEDLQVRFSNKKNLFEIIKDQLLSDNGDVENRLYTVSRFCGITPYYQDNFELLSGQKKLNFTLLSFILLCKFSLKYISLADNHFYVTAMFHHNIFERLRVFKHGNSQAVFELPNVNEILLSKESDLKSFFPGAVAFRHPTYFFKIKELVQWIKKMSVHEKINNYILRNDIDWDVIKDDLNVNKLKVVSKLASFGELLDDEKLNKSLVGEVPLSLVLKLIHHSEFQKKINKFLENLNFNG